MKSTSLLGWAASALCPQSKGQEWPFMGCLMLAPAVWGAVGGLAPPAARARTPHGLCMGLQTCRTTRTELEGTVSSGLTLAEPQLCGVNLHRRDASSSRAWLHLGEPHPGKGIRRRRRSLGDPLQQVPMKLVPVAIWRWQEFPPVSKQRWSDGVLGHGGLL